MHSTNIHPNKGTRKPFADDSGLRSTHRITNIRTALQTNIRGNRTRSAPNSNSINNNRTDNVRHRRTLTIPPLRNTVNTQNRLHRMNILIQRSITHNHRTLRRPQITLPNRQGGLVARRITRVTNINIHHILTPSSTTRTRGVTRLLINTPRGQTGSTITTPQSKKRTLHTETLCHVRRRHLNAIVHHIHHRGTDTQTQRTNNHTRLINRLIHHNMTRLTNRILSIHIA